MEEGKGILTPHAQQFTFVLHKCCFARALKKKVLQAFKYKWVNIQVK